MRPAFIYVLCDPRTGEIRYIGKTCDPSKRLSRHNEARGKTRSAAWIKSLRVIGLKPVIQVIEEFNDHDERWEEAERFYISYFRFLGMNLTNLALGGVSGKLHGEETIARFREAAKGRRLPASAIRNSVATRQTPESRERIRQAHLGHIHTEEHKRKISEAHLGKKFTDEHRARMRESWKLRGAFTDQHRQRLSESHKGIRRSDETKEKIRAAMTGRVFSHESIKRMGVAAALRVARKKAERTAFMACEI